MPKTEHITCLSCSHLNHVGEDRCEICHVKIYKRKVNSLNRTWALLLAAIICAIPANVLPIMKTSYLGNTQSDTILSGIVHLWDAEVYLIAIIIFLASFITPLFKIVSLTYLCYTCQKKSSKNISFRSKLYHFTETIGRWSMIDVFVVALLAALVQLGFFASVSAGAGIIAFLLVVILTMLAAEFFDPRLIWDNLDNGN